MLPHRVSSPGAVDADGIALNVAAELSQWLTFRNTGIGGGRARHSELETIIECMKISGEL